MTEAPRQIRRIVTVDDESGKSHAVADGPCPDVRTDPARPGYASTRIWVTDCTPARIRGASETLHMKHTLEPPRGGSVCRLIVFPPEDGYLRHIGAEEVERFFSAMGSPHASTYTARAPHPYMQKTETLDLCVVIEGEITLVLDTEEVDLKAGDTVVQRGTNHAWSNRSQRPCLVAISSHDGRY